MKLKLNKTSSFYIGFVILLTKYAMTSTCYPFNNVIGHMLVAIAIACFIVKIIYTRYAMKELCGMVILALLALTVFGFSKDDEILAIAVLIMAIKKTDIQVIIKLWTYTYGAVFVGTVLYSLITQEHIAIYDIFRIGHGYELRYCLGFHHPNSLQGSFFKIACGILLMHHNWRYYVLLFVANLALFVLTNSRAGAMSAALVIVGIAFIRGIKKNRFTFKSLRNLELFGTLLITTGTVALTYSYDRYLWIALADQIFSGRMRWARVFANRVPVSLFGAPLPKLSGHGEFVTEGGIAFDCGIMRTFLNYGIIIFILLVIACLVAIYFFWKDKHIIEPVIILGCILYATCENAFFNPFQNIGMLLVLYSVCWHIIIKEKSEVVRE